ncbi:MAG: glycosyl hydrolase 108 family protein [Alphaproteobacteria bacterium]|jgi:hypothetical protein|nr:glycosyl hydrolase 108 family protein [Alphaproteobacteria bacterium]
MAIQVPVYNDRRVQQQGIPNVRQNIDAPSAAFGSLQAEGLMRAGTAIGKLGQQWEKKAIDIAQENNELRALQMQTEAEREMSDFLYNPEQGLLTVKGQNALNAPQMTAQKLAEIQKRFDGQTEENTEVRSMFQRAMIQMGRRYGDLAQRHALGEYTNFKNETLDSRLNLNMQEIALNYMDDADFNKRAQENFDLLQSRATSEGWGEEKLADEKRKIYAGMRGTQINAMIAAADQENDPTKTLLAATVYREARARGQINDFETAMKIEALLGKAVPKAAATIAYQRGRFGASMTDPDSIVSFVIDQLEGGEQIAQEPDGAIAKFGINSKWNPDVDVENLDRAGAEKIYKEKYWKSYGIDELPDNVKLLAFDIAVNHRSDFAKKMIGELKKGASPDRIMDARLREYDRLATSDPEKYGKYYDGWKDRLNRIATQMSSTMPVDSAAVRKAADDLDRQYPGAGAELIALHDNQMKAQAAAETARKNEIQTQVTQIVSQNNGDWTKVPAQIRAEAASLGIDVTAYKGVSDPDVVAGLDAMTSSELMSANLDAPEIVQNVTFDDLQKYKTKQAELQKPENKFNQELVDGVVEYYFRSQGKSSAYDPDNKKNKQSVAAMRNYVNYRIELERASGKPLEKQHVMKFAADYISMKKKPQISDMFAIPEQERERIVSQLISINVSPTPEAVWATYMATVGKVR